LAYFYAFLGIYNRNEFIWEWVEPGKPPKYAHASGNKPGMSLSKVDRCRTRNVN